MFSLNALLEPQLLEFTEERQMQCVEVYKKINKLDQPTKLYNKLCKDLNMFDNTMANLMNRIHFLKASIPEKMRITNYNIKIKTDPADSCAKAYRNDG